MPGSDPIVKFPRRSPGDGQVNSQCRIHRSLGHHTPTQLAIFGVTPGALVLAKRLSSGRERVKTGLGVDKEVAVFLVVNDRLCFRIKVGRVADFVLIDPEIMVKEDPDLSLRFARIRNLNPSEEKVVMTSNGVATVYL